MTFLKRIKDVIEEPMRMLVESSRLPPSTRPLTGRYKPVTPVRPAVSRIAFWRIIMLARSRYALLFAESAILAVSANAQAADPPVVRRLAGHGGALQRARGRPASRGCL